MRYHNITKDDMLNGDGLRVVLWVAGCTHQCEGCHNPCTWNINGGIPFDEKAETELFDALDKDYISGVTFSGGDPLHPANASETGRLIKKVHKKFPDKTIWLYTGFLWEEICSMDFIKYVDVVVDGEFKKDLKDNTLMWRGSANQRVIDVKRSLKEGQAISFINEEKKICRE